MTTYPTHQDVMARLRKIEGQVKGIGRMIEDRRYCIDIIQQLTAIRRALDQVGMGIMRRHINSCVTEAIRHQDGSKKIDVLMETIGRFVK